MVLTGGTVVAKAVMRTAATDAASSAVPIDDTVIASEQGVADAFKAAGLIPGAVRFADFADRRFNATAGSPS